MRVRLLIGETGSVLKDHDLLVFDFFFEAIDTDGIEQPVPSSFGESLTVLVCGE